MAETLRDFAISRYQRAGVAECCLRLQDDIGADINMLLTAAWLAEREQCWSYEDVRGLVARCKEWREQCILPIRAVRRYLKGHPLHQQSKALELDAELHQLQLLDEALKNISMQSDKRVNALRQNLFAYLDCIAPNQPTNQLVDLRRLMDLLLV